MGIGDENKLAVSVFSATLGASLSSVFPGLDVAVAPAMVVIESLGQRVVSNLSARQSRSRVLAVNAAVSESGLDLEGLLTTIQGDERLLLAFAEVMTAAQKTEWDEKVEALGRVLGRMVSDSAQIDPSLVWLDVLRQVDRQHMRVLQRALEVQWWRYPHGYDGSFLATRAGLGPVVAPLITVLINLSLLGGGGVEGPLAAPFYELLGVEMPPKKPPVRILEDPAFEFDEVDAEAWVYVIRKLRDIAYDENMIWLTASTHLSTSDFEVRFDADGQFLVEVYRRATFLFEEGWDEMNMVLVWIQEGFRYEQWLKPRTERDHPEHPYEG